MEEQINNVATAKPVPKRNPGWFLRGDHRINRDGRPRKSWAAYEDRAPCAGRLKLLWVPRRNFIDRLSSDSAPGMVNLPADCEVISIRLDADRDAFALVIRSESFPRIAKGAPIPEFTPVSAPPSHCAPADDRLKVLRVPGQDLTHRLSQQNAPWIMNLPSDCEVVASRADADQDSVTFVLRSQTFPVVVKSTPIPEFIPEFNGLRWQRR